MWLILLAAAQDISSSTLVVKGYYLLLFDCYNIFIHIHSPGIITIITSKSYSSCKTIFFIINYSISFILYDFLFFLFSNPFLKFDIYLACIFMRFQLLCVKRTFAMITRMEFMSSSSLLLKKLIPNTVFGV